MDAVEFLKTANRMCYKLNCPHCPLNNNEIGLSCTSFRKKYPEEYVSIVEKWAQEHPDNTKSKKFVIRLDAEIEFSADVDTKEDATAAFFEELSYIKTGELIKADYDIEEV